jgi:hypothetical protein
MPQRSENATRRKTSHDREEEDGEEAPEPVAKLREKTGAVLVGEAIQRARDPHGRNPGARPANPIPLPRASIGGRDRARLQPRADRHRRPSRAPSPVLPRGT